MIWQRILISGLVVLSISALARATASELGTAHSNVVSDTRWRDASCIAVAANLGSCLNAMSASSTMTTLEESDCCASLLGFQQAHCYCLSPQSLDTLAKADRWAFKRRLGTLHNVHQRCGWESFDCPGGFPINRFLGVVIETQDSEQTAASLPYWSNQISYQENAILEPILQESSHDYLSESNELSQRGNELGLRTWSTERQSSEGSDLAEYLRVAIDMANVVSKTSNAQVEISIEMMVESSQEEAYEPVYSLKRGSLAKWAATLAAPRPDIWQSLQLVLLSTICLLLLTLGVIILRQKSSPMGRDQGSGTDSACAPRNKAGTAGESSAQFIVAPQQAAC